MDGFIYQEFNRELDPGFDLSPPAKPLITARLALSEDVLREAWAVRHAAYAAQGLITPNETGMLADDWDFSPATRVIVIYKSGDPVATSRISLYAPDSGIPGSNAVPSMAMFEAEIPLMYQDIPHQDDFPWVVDVSRLGRHPSLGTDCEPVFAMYRMICYLLLHYKADALISAVQKHHVPFYKRLGFQKMAEPKAHPRLNLSAALMACIRTEGGHLRDVLRILGLVSEKDSNFAGFIAGERVPVFGTGPAPAELSGIFGGRLEGLHGKSSMRERQAENASLTEKISIAA